MAKTQDFTTMMKDMMGPFSMDPTFIKDALKSRAALGEKLTHVYLDAADKTTELTSKFTKDTLAKVGVLAEVKAQPTDYAKAITDFASAFTESSTATLTAYAEIAHKVQSETMELLAAAGNDLSEETKVAVKKGTEAVTAAAKQATQNVAAAATPATA